MEKAFKFRIYPNKTQQVLLQKTFGCARFIYNHFLAKRIALYKQDKSSMETAEVSAKEPVPKNKGQFKQEQG